MKIKRKLHIHCKNDDLEPLFVMDKEPFPMHIKYITLQMPPVVERTQTRKPIVCICTGLVATVLITALVVILLLELTVNNNDNKVPPQIVMENVSRTIISNITSTRMQASEALKGTEASGSKVSQCYSSCRLYSAFRFKSKCENGKCRCRGRFYNTETCLPVVRHCLIKKVKSEKKKLHSHDDTYQCTGNNENSTTNTHVLSIYGSTRHKTTKVTIHSIESQDAVLVLANFLPTEWKIHIKENVTVKAIYMISNKYLDKSQVLISPQGSDISPPVRLIYSRVGYGDDKFGGYTVDLLRTIYQKVGPIASFLGTKYSDSLLLNV